MPKAVLSFTKTARVREVGEACVDVRNPNDLEEVFKKAHELDFSMFRYTDREYDEEEWEFTYEGGVDDDGEPEAIRSRA